MQNLGRGGILDFFAVESKNLPQACIMHLLVAVGNEGVQLIPKHFLLCDTQHFTETYTDSIDDESVLIFWVLRVRLSSR